MKKLIEKSAKSCTVEYILHPKTIKKISKMARLNMTELQIIEALKVNVATYYKAKRNNDTVAKAIIKGKQDGITFAVTQLMKAIKAGNVTAIKFYLERMDRKTWGNDPVNVIGDVTQNNVKINLVINPVPVVKNINE